MWFKNWFAPFSLHVRQRGEMVGACELQAKGNILLSTEAAQNFAGFQFRHELEPFSVQVLFRAGKTWLSDSKKRLKKAYKTDLQASCTSNSSYTMAFRWFKCKWIKDIWIAFPLKYAWALKWGGNTLAKIFLGCTASKTFGNDFKCLEEPQTLGSATPGD